MSNGDGWEVVGPSGSSDGGWESVSPPAPPTASMMPKEEVPLWVRGLQAGGRKLNELAAVPEAALSLGTGLAGTVLGGYAGLAKADREEGAAAVQRVQEGMTYQPRTEGGKKIVGAISAPFEWLGKKATRAGEWVTDETGQPALGAATKTAIETAIPAGLGKGAQVAARSLARPVDPKVKQAGQQGFAMTPDEAGAGIGSRMAASLSGEPRLARTISNKNAALATEKVVEDLGLPKGTVLDLDTLKEYRSRAGQVHEEVRGAGRIQVSPEYNAALDALWERYGNAARDFPDMAPKDIKGIIDAARRPSFDASAGVDLIQQLRKSADEAFAGRKTGLGKVYRGIADAVEGEIGRHLEASAHAVGEAGNIAQAQQLLGLSDRFKTSRTQIAKSYLAEKALVGDEINPQAYATAYRKRKPLTGGAAEVGEFAYNFPRSAQKPSHMGSGATAADAALALWGGMRSAGKEIPFLFARPVARSVIASEPYQAALIRRPGQATRALASERAGMALGLGPFFAASLPEEIEEGYR